MNFLRKDVVVHDLVQSLGIITISNTRTSFLKKMSFAWIHLILV